MKYFEVYTFFRYVICLLYIETRVFMSDYCRVQSCAMCLSIKWEIFDIRNCVLFLLNLCAVIDL